MDPNRREDLEEVQDRDYILVINEFDFPFFRFDILPKMGTIILQLQGVFVLTSWD
jgi:hypothetical protein